jgi:two-component system CheB/CheR fusion protein
MNKQNNIADFESLLHYLKESRRFDFSGYKPSSLMRRITQRMNSVGIDNYKDYTDYLEVHPEEFNHLFNTILINVTTFFRDRPAWEYLSSEILPQILAKKESGELIRVWSAGCSSGQETYTIAMVIAENIGIEAFKNQVKIFGTDMDEDALNQARQASYSQKEIADVPAKLLKKYFDQYDTRYVFNKELRRSIIFGRHNLIKDAPIARVDLLICRNTLMYFNTEGQQKITDRFHFALNDTGFLFLGKAEMLFSRSSKFIPVDLKRRIFGKVQGLDSRRSSTSTTAVAKKNMEMQDRTEPTQLYEIAFNIDPVAQIVVNINGYLALANESACKLFGLKLSDLGRPLQDLELSYRPVELRSLMQQVYEFRRMITINEVEWPTISGEPRCLDIQLIPMSDANNLLGVKILFSDVTRYKNLQDQLQHSNQELESAYEELQSANEELETTNEELQSANEELETTNEELQSANEELETTNEELQSTNEELQALNEELHQRTTQLNQVNVFLESILASVRIGVVVVDQELQVQIWNHKAEDLWGLRAEEVQGKHFLNLDIGLPVEQLRQPIRSCLAKESNHQEVTLEAINRRGKTIVCKATATPLIGKGINFDGVIMLIEEVPS